MEEEGNEFGCFWIFDWLFGKNTLLYALGGFPKGPLTLSRYGYK